MEVVTTVYQTGVTLTKEEMAPVEAHIDRLNQLGCEVTYKPGAKAEKTFAPVAMCGFKT